MSKSMTGGEILTAAPMRISIEESARVSGLSQWSIKDLLRKGKIRAQKSGRRTLILYSSLKEYLDNLPEAEFSEPKKHLRRDETVEVA